VVVLQVWGASSLVANEHGSTAATRTHALDNTPWPRTLPTLQAENRDLTQPESGSLVAGLLTKGLGGLGRLGLGSIAAAAAAAQTSRRPRISEYPAVLLFVVGGISTADVRAVRQELEQHVYGHKPLVLLAGSSLLSPLDASRLFCSS
jgi:hypothetical protein